MNGWSSRAGADRWDDQPGWIYEITWEWEPLPGQRYPGDEGRRKVVHTSVYGANRPVDPEDFGPPTVGAPPADPQTWSDPAGRPEDTHELSRDTPPSRPARQEPSWNRLVPLPERLPDALRQRPAGPTGYDQRTPFRDGLASLQDALAGYYGPRTAPPEPSRTDARPAARPEVHPRGTQAGPAPSQPPPRSAPAQSAPAQSAPAQSAPAQLAPAQLAPAQRDPRGARAPYSGHEQPLGYRPQPSRPPEGYPGGSYGSPAGRHDLHRPDAYAEPKARPDGYPPSGPRYDERQPFGYAEEGRYDGRRRAPSDPMPPYRPLLQVPAPSPAGPRPAPRQQPSIIAPRSAVPGPPSVVARQPMPPIVAEPPTPTRLTPPSGPSQRYRAAPPTSPYEPRPRHAPAPRPEQDRPIRPELPPERQVPPDRYARPRDEPGERTDDLHLMQRRELSAMPVATPPQSDFESAAEPVTAPPADPYAPILIPLEPWYPDPAESAQPGSGAPTSPSGWFEAPVSAPPATADEATDSQTTDNETTHDETTHGETTVDLAAQAVTRFAPPVVAPVEVNATVDEIDFDDEPAEDEEPEAPLVDPEQVLATYTWRFDPETLREQADEPDRLRAVRDRLTDKLEYAERHAVRARLLSLRAVVSRVLGDYPRAVADGRRALKHAQATGELRRIAIAQARLAHVLQWRGDYAEADRRYAEADSPELPDRLRAEISELAGRSAFEQGRYLEAITQFERALDVRRGDDPEQIARIEQSLDTITGKIVDKSDWGPYARGRSEILDQPAELHPTLGFESTAWGYADRDGELVVPERYAEARPFHDGLAWVLRPKGRAWELIDAEGTALIGESAGYRAVRPFAEGLAWVSRDTSGGWVAIDRTNRVIVPGGFDDVRAFHRGLAPVRRVGWGAVDRHGRLVVPPRFLGFATALTTGRHLDGFTDEGLAIVDAGNQKGVVDHTGRLIVPPVHASLLIHPVAFVISDRDGRWGALDRQGEPLIELAHDSPAEVADEIDRLLSNTRPVL